MMILVKLTHIWRLTVHVKPGNPLVIGRILLKYMRTHLTILLELHALMHVALYVNLTLRPLLNKDVIIESVVSVQDRHETHDLRAMRHVIRRVALTQLALHHVIATAAHGSKGAANQIVNHCNALRRHAKGYVRKQKVIVDQGRAMSNLDENVLTHHAALQLLSKFRTLIVMHQILRNTRALCLPVRPNAHGAVMNIISSHRHVDCRVQLDASDLRTAQLHHVVDVMNVIVLNDREHAAHTANDAALLAIMNVVAANDMTANLLLEPAMILSATNCVTLHLRSTLNMLEGKIMIVCGIIILTDTDTSALTVTDFAVLNDPALRPVRADHTVLECRGRRPGRCCLADLKAADCNIANARLRREEALPANVDLDQLLIRILVLEIHIKYRASILLLCIPLINGILGHPRGL